MLLRGLRCALPVTSCIFEGKLSPFPYQSQTEEYGMKLFIGLDVSLKKAAVCVVNEHGHVVALTIAKFRAQDRRDLAWAL